MMDIGLWTSVVMEVHIAAGFLSLVWRAPRLMKFLKRTILFTWVIGTVMVSGEVYLTHFRLDGQRELLCFGYGAALCTTSTLYVMAWFRSWWSPLRQAQRAHRMVHLYLAAFFVTMSPILICLRFNLDTDVADAFLALNGVLNVLLYSFQSSFSSAMWLDTGEAHGTVMAQWAGRSSIPVTFSMRVPLEVKVSAVQRAALAESEREIADMERARSDPREDQKSGAADTGRELMRCGWV